MMKKHGKLLVITSIIILLPALVGVILWNQLPEQIPTHWNAAGEIDGWSSKGFGVFGLSGILLAVQWLCALGTGADPKKRNHSNKIVQMVLWIIPVLSIVLYAMTYTAALGKDLPVSMILAVVVGIVFTVIGNYLPKCKQNYTIGIKIPWTLNSEENWNKTHRLAGWVWSVCGILVILSGFLGCIWILLGVMLPMILVPVIYSYILHRKGI